MTAEGVIRSPGGSLAAQVDQLQQAGLRLLGAVDYWRKRAERAETRVQELEAEIEASTSVDLLERYRRVCVEKAAMARQLDLWLRGHPLTVERRAVVESLVCGATVRAERDALRGNR